MNRHSILVIVGILVAVLTGCVTAPTEYSLTVREGWEEMSAEAKELNFGVAPGVDASYGGGVPMLDSFAVVREDFTYILAVAYDLYDEEAQATFDDEIQNNEALRRMLVMALDPEEDAGDILTPYPFEIGDVSSAAATSLEEFDFSFATIMFRRGAVGFVVMIVQQGADGVGPEDLGYLESIARGMDALPR